MVTAPPRTLVTRRLRSSRPDGNDAAMTKRTPLGELIYKVRSIDNTSGQKVADRATAHGFAMSKQAVSLHETTVPATVNPQTIRGLAAGLGISEARVAQAVLETWGIRVGFDEVPLRQAILDSTEIDSRTRRALLAIVDLDREAGEGHDRPAPNTAGESDTPNETDKELTKGDFARAARKSTTKGRERKQRDSDNN